MADQKQWYMTAYLCLRLALRKQIMGKCTTKGEVGEGTQNHISFSSLSDCHNIFETNCMPSCKLVVFIFVCCIWEIFIFVCCIWEIWGVGMTEIRGRFLAHWSVALAVVLAAHPFPFLHCAMHTVCIFHWAKQIFGSLKCHAGSGVGRPSIVCKLSSLSRHDPTPPTLSYIIKLNSGFDKFLR